MADLTRLEQFLNHIAHPEDPIPAPLTRMEQSLLEIAENKDEAALPDYSEASDGDVLSIEDGAPAWKEPSGGGDMFVANMTLKEDWQSEADVEFDKTYDEIAAAFADGKIVVAKCLGKGIRAVDKRELIDSSIVYQVTMMEIVTMESTAYLVVYVYQLDSTNAVTLDGGFYTLTPAN